MTMSPEELRGALEAILFVAGEPVTVEQLSEALGGESKEEIAGDLEAIREKLDQNGSGFVLEQTAGGFRFATRPAYDPYLRKFFAKQGEKRLSIAGLETLAIIAYRQPITAPEINEIRGVNSSGVLSTLLDRRMIRVAGRKPVVGSPFLYRTTREFLVHFGLNSIQDLPRLEEFSEILGVNLSEELLGPGEETIVETPMDHEEEADHREQRGNETDADGTDHQSPRNEQMASAGDQRDEAAEAMAGPLAEGDDESSLSEDEGKPVEFSLNDHE
jgi:segregation and condensation protein B